MIRGAVQGVGFRPFVYRLAGGRGLRGWVNNSAQGVFVEAEGRREELNEFLLSIERESPPRSFIQSLEYSFLDPVGYESFEIRESASDGQKTSLVLPDIATCDECLRDIFDPGDRRYLYPFTNCTNCGPRFSIIRALPYDRPNTTMKSFIMCEACSAEYEDPSDRRFHAQPNACPDCGPGLELWDATGKKLAPGHEALLATAEAVRQGRVAAVKGIGGFHLIVDARSEAAISRLREAKHREEKPLALMFPSMDAIRAECRVSELEGRLLRSPESPIVLLSREGREPFGESVLADSVAPGNPHLGAMLPYTPLHHVLMAELGFPIVATSGNLSDEPICTDEQEAAERLSGIADLFLVHDRPIARHVDDSVARVILGREAVVRRARGYAPLPVRVKDEAPPVLAVGAHLKNAVAVSIGRDVFVSQHVGDLETTQAFEAFHQVIGDLQGIYGHEAAAVACDAHPDYLSTGYAERSGLPVERVQHHYAHILSCMAENEIQGPVLGVSWDGTGYGPDGTIWGGEFLRATVDSFTRSAHFRTFRLPGGDTAIREPRRAAVGLLHELLGESMTEHGDLHPMRSFAPGELRTLLEMLRAGVNSPRTSSVGRLFDVVAALTGLRQVNSFEGQAAMMLEFALQDVETGDAYPVDVVSPIDRAAGMEESAPALVDWGPMMRCVLDDVRRAEPVGVVSARFHNGLAEAILAVARMAGEGQVVLSGGCFQNAYLVERTVGVLEREGFRPYWHQRIPPNDGGISLGQAVAAMRALRRT